MAVLRIAVSLATGEPIDLRAELPHIGLHRMSMVLAALASAAGSEAFVTVFPRDSHGPATS